MTDFGLAGARVLVTGASRGIGEALARGFAAAGAHLHVLAEDAGIETVAATLSDIAARPVKAWRCDITDEARLGSVMAEIGPLDVLINNAGLELLTPIRDESPEVLANFRRIVDINVTGTFLVTRHAVRQMADGGRIVNTSSLWGRSAEAEFAAYVASKHAVIGLTRTLAKELGRSGIRVNAVCPGWIRTEAALRSARTMAALHDTTEQAVIDSVLAAQSMDGLLEPADIVNLYLFLASPLSANITGQSIVIDRGGLLA
ncbi:MAG: SDR family NAD(P)-dependent oxidoreductase [Dongiaceae bacterium]